MSDDGAPPGNDGDGPKGPPSRSFDGPLFTRALARARQELAKAAPPAGAGYRLFWVSGDAVGWFDLPARGAYAIAGSHEQCDVVLRGDARIALRHLLATTIELADGLALRLLDLQTDLPFRLEDGAPRASIVAAGPIVASLGNFVIGGFPTTPGKVEIPDGPTAVAIEESLVLPVSVRAPATLAPVARLEKAISYVTSMPPASSIAIAATSGGDELSFDDACGSRPIDGRSGVDGAWARVTLRQGEKAASVGLGRASLEAGVLIGRLKQCPDRRLLEVLTGGVSRGHVLLFRHHDVCEAFDLCSTQGTFLGTKRVRRVRLDPDGTELRLASNDPVALEWTGG